MASYALESGGLAEVTSVLRSNYDVVLNRGYSIDSLEHGKGIKDFRPSHILNKVPEVVKDGLPRFDYIIVATKNVPDVRPSVLDLIEPAVTPTETTIVLLQNGLHIEKPIIERFPGNVVWSGVSIISASEPSHGVIIHELDDICKVGPFDALEVPAATAEAEARRLVTMYNACGKVKWQFDDNVSFTRWRKLIYNSSFNSVSAILKMGVVRMRMTRHIIDDLVRPAMLEIVATAKAAGIELPDGVDDFFIHLDPADEDFMPSMGQDSIKVSFYQVHDGTLPWYLLTLLAC